MEHKQITCPVFSLFFFFFSELRKCGGIEKFRQIRKEVYFPCKKKKRTTDAYEVEDVVNVCNSCKLYTLQRIGHMCIDNILLVRAGKEKKKGILMELKKL